MVIVVAMLRTAEEARQRLPQRYPTCAVPGLDLDVKETAGRPGLGKRTRNWLKAIGGKMGQAGLAIGVEVVKQEATKWIFKYHGLHA